MFPTITQYNQAINARGLDTFDRLSGVSFIPSRTVPVKIYSYGSGSYAVVFKAEDSHGQYAIRCFISAEQENIERYRAISSYLNSLSATWIAKLFLLENEIEIGGARYPVIKMDWVSGDLINHYITRHLQNDRILSSLQTEIVEVSRSLEKNLVGHGDIQCGNIIVQDNGNGDPKIKLIDYDGMFIPSFSHKRNLERGRSEFQHPQRSLLAYNQKMDRFSFWVMLTALEALKFDKTLWLEKMQGGFNTLDNFLFEGTDFVAPNNSKLVSRLYSLRQPSMDYYLQKLVLWCSSDPNLVAEPGLYLNSSPQQQAVDTVAEEDYDGIRITSIPSGAVVLTTLFKPLGKTPITLNRNEYRNKTVIVTFANESKRVEISDHVKIEITFSQSWQHSNGYNPVISPVQPQTGVQPTIQEQNQIYTPPPNVDPPSDGKKGWMVVGAMFLILLIIVIAAIGSKKQESPTVSYSSATNSVDQTQSIPPSYDNTLTSVDTAVMSVDTTVSNSTTASVTTTPSTDNIEKNSLAQQAVDDANGETALDVVNRFFSDLNNSNASAAWLLTYNPIWESRGEKWFESPNGFGNVSKATIKTIQTINANSTDVVVRVEYYLEDSYNGSKCYNQNISLKKTALGDDVVGRWMIVDMENLIDPYDCQ